MSQTTPQAFLSPSPFTHMSAASSVSSRGSRYSGSKRGVRSTQSVSSVKSERHLRSSQNLMHHQPTHDSQSLVRQSEDRIQARQPTPCKGSSRSVSGSPSSASSTRSSSANTSNSRIPDRPMSAAIHRPDRTEHVRGRSLSPPGVHRRAMSDQHGTPPTHPNTTQQLRQQENGHAPVTPSMIQGSPRRSVRKVIDGESSHTHSSVFSVFVYSAFLYYYYYHYYLN